ncbi:RING finger protein 37 [Coemansia sp. Benny D115]|nr:RING finger protein 37 [Coemansia sp. Benny D115]
MATANTASDVKLFDYADSRLGTTAQCEYPSVNGYEVLNLLDKQRQAGFAGADQVISAICRASRPSGFMVEPFVKPPVDIIITLHHYVSLAAIVINPRIRMHSAKVVTLHIWNDRLQKWDYVARLVWEDDHAVAPRGVCNQELGWQPVAQASALQGKMPAVSHWLPIEKAASALHFVSRIKLRVSSVHGAQPPGLGAVEIWAQPSQRLPQVQRNQEWDFVWRALAVPENNNSCQKDRHASIAANGQDTSYSATPAKCPPDYIDYITQSIMRDPVTLPSGANCDRTTIIKHLESSKTDPFTGLPMDHSQVKSNLVLQQRIESWLRNQ